MQPAPESLCSRFTGKEQTSLAGSSMESLGPTRIYYDFIRILFDEERKGKSSSSAILSVRSPSRRI